MGQATAEYAAAADDVEMPEAGWQRLPGGDGTVFHPIRLIDTRSADARTEIRELDVAQCAGVFFEMLGIAVPRKRMAAMRIREGSRKVGWAVAVPEEAVVQIEAEGGARGAGRGRPLRSSLRGTCPYCVLSGYWVIASDVFARTIYFLTPRARRGHLEESLESQPKTRTKIPPARANVPKRREAREKLGEKKRAAYSSEHRKIA